MVYSGAVVDPVAAPVKLPIAHALHAESCEMPGVSENVPVEHAEHMLEPVSAFV